MLKNKAIRAAAFVTCAAMFGSNANFADARGAAVLDPFSLATVPAAAAPVVVVSTPVFVPAAPASASPSNPQPPRGDPVTVPPAQVPPALQVGSPPPPPAPVY